MLLWAFVQLRTDALVDAVVHIRYRCPDGRPYLYAVALYNHHEYRFFSDGLSEMSELKPEMTVHQEGRQGAAKDFPPARTWVQRDGSSGTDSIVAKVTLTSSQLLVIATAQSDLTGSSIDSRPRLDFHCISEARR